MLRPHGAAGGYKILIRHRIRGRGRASPHSARRADTVHTSEAPGLRPQGHCPLRRAVHAVLEAQAAEDHRRDSRLRALSKGVWHRWGIYRHASSNVVHRRLREIYGVAGAIGGGVGDAGTSPAGSPAADCLRRSSSSSFAKSRIRFLSASGRKLSPPHSCLSSSAAKPPASPNRPLVLSLGSICLTMPRAAQED